MTSLLSPKCSLGISCLDGSKLSECYCNTTVKMSLERDPVFAKKVNMAPLNKETIY